MTLISFVKNQISQIRRGDSRLLLKKTLTLCTLPLILIIYILAIPVVIIIRLVRPWILIRFGLLISDRIGHFAANTELYLCERDSSINVPAGRYLDIFYVNSVICNRQLLLMWRRLLVIWPRLLVGPVHNVNKWLSGWEIHEIGNNTQSDRDVNNLLEKTPPHLSFTKEEEIRGRAGLEKMGISQDDPIVCLLVRDSAYLDDSSWSYHAYRDSSIQNYKLAVEELANRGYYVLRMGAKVNAPLVSKNPKVQDYATNGMRSDFMDIYLGAKCDFCISTSSGWDAIPLVFRRPTAYTNMVPIGYLFTFLKNSLGITKRHFSVTKNRYLSLSEIFQEGVGFCMTAAEYESKKVRLVENNPEDIRDLIIEFEERLQQKWALENEDEVLQTKFWNIFPQNSLHKQNGRPLHGKINLKYGAHSLRNDPDWLI